MKRKKFEYKGRIYNSFIYIWRDRLTGMFYIGSHIGSPKDGYVGSGVKFRPEYFSRPGDFRRRILLRLNIKTDDKLRAIEEELLLNRKKKWHNYFNVTTGALQKTSPLKNQTEELQQYLLKRDEIKTKIADPLDEYKKRFPF